MARDSSSISLFVKFSLFFLNILFWLMGLVVLGVGIYARTLKALDTVVKNTFPWYYDPTIYLIIIGGVIFILAFLGCIGSLRENITMLKIFEYSIDFIMLVEIAMVVGVYLARNKFKKAVKDALFKTIPQYRDDPDLQSIIDFFQLNIKCCGINDYKDWDHNIYFNCSSPGAEACGVPYSCCKDANSLNTQCGYSVRSTSTSNVDRQNKIYTIGCVDGTINLLLSKTIIYWAIGIGAGIIVIQLFATGLSHSMITGIRQQIMKQRRSQPINAHQNTGFD